MKETIQFSIGGYAFTLEKDAATELQEYITALENHYLPQDGGKEIMEGIEERVAELLLEKCGKVGVVSLDQVQYVIRVIGRPERIEADDPGPERPSGEKQTKRLFRDLENKRLGGVCAGLAAYLQVDVNIFRIAFVVLTLIGFITLPFQGVLFIGAPVIYGILWLAMPPARTAQDRWAMHGNGTTVDEISRNIQAGFEEIGQTAREVGQSDFFQKFGRFIAIAVGLLFLIIGTSGLASVSIISFNGIKSVGLTWQMIHDSVIRHLPFMTELMADRWLAIPAAMAVILPFVGILYAGIQMIFGFRSPSWKPGLVIFVLWLIALVVLGVAFFTGMLTSEYFTTIEPELFDF